VPKQSRIFFLTKPFLQFCKHQLSQRGSQAFCKRKRSTDIDSDDGESYELPFGYDKTDELPFDYGETDELPSDYISSDDEDAMVEIMMYTMYQTDAEDSKMWESSK
jgi:hypothetical protein